MVGWRRWWRQTGWHLRRRAHARAWVWEDDTAAPNGRNVRSKQGPWHPKPSTSKSKARQPHERNTTEEKEKKKREREREWQRGTIASRRRNQVVSRNRGRKDEERARNGRRTRTKHARSDAASERRVGPLFRHTPWALEKRRIDAQTTMIWRTERKTNADSMRRTRLLRGSVSQATDWSTFEMGKSPVYWDAKPTAVRAT